MISHAITLILWTAFFPAVLLKLSISFGMDAMICQVLASTAERLHSIG